MPSQGASAIVRDDHHDVHHDRRHRRRPEVAERVQDAHRRRDHADAKDVREDEPRERDRELELARDRGEPGANSAVIGPANTMPSTVTSVSTTAIIVKSTRATAIGLGSVARS